MDIVIFKETEISKIDSPNLQMGKDYIKPFIGIELGTQKTSNHDKHIVNDLKKLIQNDIGKGYLIYIIKDESYSSIRSGRGDNTINKLNRIKKCFHVCYPSNVIPLIFILKITKLQRSIWGKCEFYIGDNKWRYINLQNIGEDISVYLTSKL